MRVQNLLFASVIYLLSVPSGVSLGGSAPPVHGRQACQLSKLPTKLVDSFRADKVSLIDALLQLARQEQIPLGIEYVDFEALEKPIAVNLGPATISEVLDAILKQGSGYSWSVQDCVVNVSHASISENSGNLLNTRLPRFSVPSVSLQEGSHVLEMTLDHEIHPQVQRWFGSFPAGTSPKRIGPLDLHNITVKQAVNRLVAEAGGAAWIVQVPPGKLGRLPSYGLWRIIEYDTAPRPYGPFLLQILRDFDSRKPVGSKPRHWN